MVDFSTPDGTVTVKAIPDAFSAFLQSDNPDDWATIDLSSIVDHDPYYYCESAQALGHNEPDTHFKPLSICIILGKIEHFQYLLQQHYQPTFLINTVGFIARSNRADLLQDLINRVVTIDLAELKVMLLAAFHEALTAGANDVLVLCKTKMNPADFDALINAYQSVVPVITHAVRAGQTETVALLTAWIRPDALIGMIKWCDYKLFRSAVKNDSVALLQLLWCLAPELHDEMLTAKGGDAFYKAAKYGNVDALKQLWQWATTEAQKQILLTGRLADEEISALTVALISGQLEAALYIDSLITPEQRQQQLEIHDSPFHPAQPDIIIYPQYAYAAGLGRKDIIDQLCEWLPGQEAACVRESDFIAFGLACYRGQPFSEDIRLEADELALFNKNKGNDHLAILHHFIDIIPSDQHADMITSNDFKPFKVAAENGDVELLQQLAAWLPDDRRAELISQAINHNNYALLRKSILNNHIAATQLLLTWAGDQAPAILASNHYELVRIAAENDNLEMLRILVATTPAAQHSDLFSCSHFSLFRSAANNNNLDMLRAIAGWAPGLLPDMLQAESQPDRLFPAGLIGTIRNMMGLQVGSGMGTEKYAAFISAASNGNVAMMRQIRRWSGLPDHPIERLATASLLFKRNIDPTHDTARQLRWQYAPDMICASSYAAFREAVYNGQFAAMQQLVEWLPKHKSKMVQTIKLDAAHSILWIFHDDTALQLIDWEPRLLGCAERHLHTYVQRQALRLIGIKVKQWQASAAPIELNDQQATLGYFMLRRLIRQSDPAYQELTKHNNYCFTAEKITAAIDFLIAMPAIRDKLHLAVSDGETPGEADELLHIAERCSNDAVAIKLRHVDAPETAEVHAVTAGLFAVTDDESEDDDDDGSVCTELESDDDTMRHRNRRLRLG
ncbi:MAG: hypothetical protein P1U40_04270 [Coxiellaceae bacterium]|nr:hypothetical protein [Coxiellaceae bacterium]